MQGKLLILSAPSGSGKTTIVKHLLSAGLNIEFSISATSRSMRGEEVDGRDYYFFSADRFRDKIDNEEFIEWEEVYPDHYYGTLRSEIERIWSKGNHVIFDVDVIGGINLKRIFGDQALAIFIMPPSEKELKKRLIGRGTDSKESITMRLTKAKNEITRSSEFDKIIINDNLEDACSEAVEAVASFIKNDDPDD